MNREIKIIAIGLLAVIVTLLVAACAPVPAFIPTPTSPVTFTPTLNSPPTAHPSATPTLTTEPTFTTTPTVTPSILALVNGTLIDGTGAEAMLDAVLVIKDGQIVAVGPRLQVKIPADAQIIDVQGGTILPGFINAHVHNAYSYTNLVLWAIAGVTTVRDLGAPCSDNDGCRMYLKARDHLNAQPKNARLIAVGPLVTVPKGYPLAFQNFASLTITSPNDARQKVGQLLDDGADGVKIVIESGFPTLSLEETTAIVAIAHERHTWVSVHLTFSVDLEQAVKAGVDDVAHVVIDPLPEEWLQRMIADDIYLVPTLKAMEILNLPSHPHNEGTNLLRFVEAGGKVALGSDAGYIQGLKIGMPLDEILELKAAGMTPMQIIVAATKNAAHVCGLENEIGTLEVGKAADVFVVSGDPLQNLEALANVQLVIHDGIVILNEIH